MFFVYQFFAFEKQTTSKKKRKNEDWIRILLFVVPYDVVDGGGVDDDGVGSTGIAFDVQQYETVANAILQGCKENVLKLQDSTLNMANQFVVTNIDTTSTTTSTTSWQYVVLDDFEEIAIDIMTDVDDGGTQRQLFWIN